MSRSLAAVSCDNYGAVHSFLNGVFSVLCTQKLRKELKLPPEVPPGPRPIIRAESGPISAVVFFFLPPTYLKRAVCLLPRTRPPPATSGWGSGSACSPQAYCAGGTSQAPATQTGQLELDLGRDRKFFWQQAPRRGWGEAACPLEGWVLAAQCCQLYPPSRIGRTLGSNNALRPQCHLPLSFVGEELGATRTHPCFDCLWAEQGVRLNFLLGVLLKRLNLRESPGSPVVSRTRRSHSGRAFDPWSGN